MRIRWTPAAFRDLRDISSYIERQRSIPAANRICRFIYDSAQTLARFPERGRIGFDEGTRELVITKARSYIVVYRIVLPDSVEILRIWHGAQRRPQ